MKRAVLTYVITGLMLLVITFIVTLIALWPSYHQMREDVTVELPKLRMLTDEQTETIEQLQGQLNILHQALSELQPELAKELEKAQQQKRVLTPVEVWQRNVYVNQQRRLEQSERSIMDLRAKVRQLEIEIERIERIIREWGNQ